MALHSWIMKKLLVIGASGQVGSALMKHLSEKNNVVGTYSSSNKKGLVHLDITDEKEVSKLIQKINPSIIFHCSAAISIDFCEKNPDAARKINVDGTKNVVEAAKKIGAKVVYLSTEYVFDGRKGPYSETDNPNPINVYGKNKLEGEKVVLSAQNSLVIRSTLIFSLGYDTKSLLNVIVKSLKSGQEIKIVDDQITNPISADNLAEAISDLALKNKSGIYNVASKERMSRYEFAIKAAKALGLNSSLIKPVKSAYFRQNAKRPLSCGLKIDKFLRNSKVKLLSLEEAVNCYKNKI